MKQILIITALVLLGSLAAHAQILGVNLNYDTDRQGASLGSTDTAGAVGVVTTNWNNVDGATDYTTADGTFAWSNTNLTDGAGLASGVSLTASTTNTSDGPDGLWGQGGGFSGASGDVNLFSGGLQIRGATLTLNLSNLNTEFGAGQYNIYFYFSGGSDIGGNGNSISVSNGTISGSLSPTGYTGSYVDGTNGTGNYVLLTGLSGNSQTLTVAATVAFTDPHTSLAGIEIVAVPEPSVYLLLGLGLFAVMGLRRRLV